MSGWEWGGGGTNELLHARGATENKDSDTHSRRTATHQQRLVVNKGRFGAVDTLALVFVQLKLEDVLWSAMRGKGRGLGWAGHGTARHPTRPLSGPG